MRFYRIFYILVLFILISCKGSPPKDQTPAVADSIRVNALPVVTVSVIPQWLHQAQFAGFYVAQKKGFYRNYGLDVRIKDGGPDHPAAEALKTGEADFASLFLLTALREFSQGNRVINIAQVSNRSALMLVAKKNSGITSISSLNGKKIGLWRSDFQEISQIFVKQNNLNLQIIPIDNSINPLLKGAVDCMNAMEYNEYHQLVQAGLDQDDLWALPLNDKTLNIPEDGIYAREEFYAMYPDICADFADATMQGWLYAINNIEEAVDIVMQVMKESYLPANRPHQVWMLTVWKDIILAQPNSLGRLNKTDFDRANNLMVEHKLIPKAIDYEVFCQYPR